MIKDKKTTLKMSLIRKYWICSTFLGSYYYGYETSVFRDKSKDWMLAIQFYVVAPFGVPYYVYYKYKKCYF